MNENERIQREAESNESSAPIRDFFVNLNEIGVFPRAYDHKSAELYQAAAIIHKHLCSLDNGYYSPTREVKLVEFANAYADVHSGLRKLE